jgi:hypothetical protein
LALVFAASAQAAMSRGFNRLLDAVVRIDVREVAFESGARRYASSIGSGVILSADGLVLTTPMSPVRAPSSFPSRCPILSA